MEVFGIVLLAMYIGNMLTNTPTLNITEQNISGNLSMMIDANSSMNATSNSSMNATAN